MGVSNRHTLQHVQAPRIRRSPRRCDGWQPPSLRPCPSLPRCPSLQGGEAPPQPFAYEYGVADDYSKANFKKTEPQDGNGVVTGSFVIALPDGRIQTTTYTADHHNGFVAEVTYEGTPVYPPEPKEEYGYHPAPAYKPAA